MFLFLQSTVYQALEQYKNSVKLEDSINNLLLIATCYQDCYHIMENNAFFVFHTLVTSLKQTTSLVHRLSLFHTLTQLCQRKKDYIDDSVEDILMVLSEVVNQIDMMAKNKCLYTLNETSSQIRKRSIISEVKQGVFFESGIVLTFLQSLLQVTEYNCFTNYY